MSHLHEKLDFTASVYIVYRNRVLLRLHDKYGIWLGPGGHVELDEDPNQAAVREAKEEVGLDIKLFEKNPRPVLNDSKHKELIPPRFMNRHPINDTHEHVDLIYFASTDSDRIVQGETEKSDLCRRFTKEELDDLTLDIHPTIRHYALTALEEVKNC